MIAVSAESAEIGNAEVVSMCFYIPLDRMLHIDRNKKTTVHCSVELIKVVYMCRWL